MYEPIWQAVKAELSGERARDYTARLWEHARWNSFDHLQKTAAEIAAILREIGLSDVQVLEYPADGTTAYGGWVMPEAWDVEDATLEIVDPVPSSSSSTLAHYRDCPMGLFMYSAPTPPEGVVAEVVAIENGAKAASYEGRDVAGKIVLVDGVGLEYGLNAFSRGAVGVVSDAMKLAGSPQEKAPGHFDHAAQWQNYAIPPWKTPQKGFGFSLSPANGRRLRELLSTHPCVKLRAVVRTRLYPGILPAVTGLLPGATSEEIAITGHLCEPGANDNNSGCALGLEVVRAVKALAEAGKLPKLQRGIRVVYSFEVRGYQAFLATWPHLRRLAAGINLDMVGNDLSEARSRANLLYNWSALPACTDALGLELMRRLGRDDPLFRFRTEPGALVDNLFGEPSVGAPTIVLGCWPDAYYHTSLDTIEHISPKAMASLGRVAATYCAFLATAGFREAAWLARLTLAFAKEQVLQAVQRGEAPERIEHAVAENVERLKSVARLVPTRSLAATRENLEKHTDWLCPWSHLFEREEIGQQAERLGQRLAAFARREAKASRKDARYAKRLGTGAKRAKTAAPSANEEQRARRLVPVRTFRGSPCFESLDEAGLKELKAKTGLTVGWGAPHWLHLALFRSNGKRTALDVWQWLQREGQAIELARLNDTVEFLAAHGFVKLRPVLTRDDYRAALDVLGVPRGAVLMVHSSVSQFGYVEGGADAVIEALHDAIGPEGTLAMPTLSYSWVGRPPYDPATTPSRVGAITEVFRKRPGVLRSPHPSHSVAAFGPRAAEITSGHVPDRPVFAPEGAYGKLYELDAWILMLCKLSSNTSMHMGDERNGLLLLDFVGHVLEGGKRREVLVRHMPCHVNFDPSYEAMRQRGQLRSAPLGEGTIHLMRARDAIDTATENVRRDPRLVTGGEKCQCDFCNAIRAKLGTP
ncbi:MAG TPA: DUF4910 domain-containing protein [Planctomycetota bacterium]|nr:DUF4910 domain-containing protein [Planctomycetota bacterium]